MAWSIPTPAGPAWASALHLPRLLLSRLLLDYFEALFMKYALRSSGSGWTENILLSLQGGAYGELPYGGVIFDQAGNLYGTTSYASGTAFQLTPSNGGWIPTLIYTFGRNGLGGPLENLVRDQAGNLYGTTLAAGAYNFGNVFKLAPSNGAWTYTDLYDFTGGSDGAYPLGLVFDPNGNMYGIAAGGGNGSGCYLGGCGVIWEITP